MAADCRRHPPGNDLQATGPRWHDLPPELIARILGFLERAHDLTAANAVSRLFRGPPIEHALRERARARGHDSALPAALPACVCTWTEELFARERVHDLACAHALTATAGGTEWFAVLSAFVDAHGAAHACGEELVGDVLSELRWDCPDALGQDERVDHVLRPSWVSSLAAVRVCAMAAGAAHVLALSDAGAVYACGKGARGQLGFGSARASGCRAFEPIQGLLGELHVAIAAGAYHNLALTAAGCAYSWGYNYDGQLGHGDTEERWEPVRIEALDGVRVGGVAAGARHTLLLSARGAVYSCGAGADAQLGHGDLQPERTPRRIEALAGVRVVHVSAGEAHSLVVDGTGGAYSCGSGKYGCLGHGASVLPRLRVPTRILPLAAVRAVRGSAGVHGSALVGADGSVHVFGSNDRGQLGVGHRRPCRVPMRVAALEHTRVVSCALGYMHALFVTAEGGVHSCGAQSGALGHGISVGAAEPAVLAPTLVARLPPLRSVAQRR